MKAFKYKLKPSARVDALLWHWLRVCRELYNSGLHERREAYRLQGMSLNYLMQAAELPAVKAGREDVARVNAQVLQDVLRRLDKAFGAFFRRVKAGEKAGFPRFRGRHRFHSFTFPQAKGAFRLAGNKLYLSKIGAVRVHLSRPLAGVPKTCTIRREAEGWYAIITCEVKSPPLPPTGEAVGIDLGVETFGRLDTGESIANPKFLRAAERRLKTAQRRVSRRKKGSRRRKKAVRLLAVQHLAVKRRRLDFFHKAARRLVLRFDHLALEDLNIIGMLKNHHLAKAISDAAWHTFVMILCAKAVEAGRVVVKVNPRFTSQDCANLIDGKPCGNRVRKSLSEREHRCVACGYVAHRDTNAAGNIKYRGGDTAVRDGSGGAPVRTEHLPGD